MSFKHLESVWPQLALKKMQIEKEADCYAAAPHKTPAN